MQATFPALLAAGPTPEPHPAMILPFALLLAAIAAMPFIHKHWWEHHYPKVSLALGSITVAYYLLVLRAGERLFHVAHEYVSFIALIGSLFVVAGGILIRVKGESTPVGNAVFLLVGAVLANLIGTTGASMLLIRPWIRMNRYRITAFHIVFFIFIVSNVGGCLTPIGDPPLFLGYLKGVPFEWPLIHCAPAGAAVVAALLAVFLAADTLNFRRAPKAVRDAETASETWEFKGGLNGLFLAGILGGIFLPSPWREAALFGLAAASYFTTPKAIHRANDFTFAPIKEVAWLFVGIFATMVPALDYLERNSGALGIDSPLKFYWLTGLLSGLLDNAPTYLTFLAAAFGQNGLSLNTPGDMAAFVAGQGKTLLAISLGAVFFGAMTYIGNGPNFMVKAIAEQNRVKTPDFLGYIWRYALPILLPILAAVGWIFFR
jgi:Na+/H+ antiporter NhaD/arsenite permease-like protein